MSDTPRLKKDGSIDRRYLPREFGKPAPKSVAPSVEAVASVSDDYGQVVIPGTLVENLTTNYAATPTTYTYNVEPQTGRDTLGQQVVPGTVQHKPQYTEPPLTYIEPNGGLSTDPRFENVAADTNMLAAPVIPVVPPGTPNTRIIHFMEDGFTALGKIWYRGEEFVVVEGSPTWAETTNKYGVSWVDMSEDEQYEKYGRRYFRDGPWRGKGYEAAEFEGEYDPEELKKLEKRRQRAASAPMKPVSG